jgi:hypothetical protein
MSHKDMCFRNAPFLTVGDIFQHEAYEGDYHAVSCVYLVIGVVPRVKNDRDDYSHTTIISNLVLYEFVCISLKTFKQSSEFQFSYDEEIPHYYKILSRNA